MICGRKDIPPLLSSRARGLRGPHPIFSVAFLLSASCLLFASLVAAAFCFVCLFSLCIGAYSSRRGLPMVISCPLPINIKPSNNISQRICRREIALIPYGDYAEKLIFFFVDGERVSFELEIDLGD